PSGQVMVAIDSGRADGTLVTNRSVYIGPHTFGGIRWVLSDGRLVEHRYRTGGKVFDQEFDAAPEGKDRFGFLSIGLNPRSRDLPPCEDTEEGSVLVGVGGNGMAGGRRRIPFMGAALIGGATLEVDGKVVASGGRIR
ncbi:MAG TPA: hypothetical protein VLY85_02200, partial [Thermoplasmata archaeon]|nr:hypothetical protein [Thermoplasmata archaeon]